jgi:[acyl-carrier-protein] S-malonyltransferase
MDPRKEMGGLEAVLVFPGQGSQEAGMADPRLLEHPTSLEVYRLASEVAGLDVPSFCNGADEEALTRTDLCQLCVAATSLAWLELLKSKGLLPSAVAGHSLGEYCAACAAGSLGLGETLELVWGRGRAMLEASRRRPGSMLALLGMEMEEVESLLGDIDGSGDAAAVCIANHNASRQVVLSGAEEGLRAAAEEAARRGARCARLRVGGPFHSKAMAEARREVERLLDGFEVKDPTVPLYSGYTGGMARSGDEVAACLAAGITSPVRWHEVQGRLSRLPVGLQVEVGPGKVLGRMAAREHPQVRFLSSLEALEMLEGEACSGG